MNIRWVVLCGLLLTAACQRVSQPSPEFTRPFYSGAVTPITQPIRLNPAPLNRKATTIADAITRMAGETPEVTKTRMQGTVESYQLGDDIQVRYEFNRMGASGGRLQSIPPLLLQTTIWRDGRIKQLEIGGPLMDQASPSDATKLRQQLQAIMKYMNMVTSEKPLMQGDTLASLSLIELFKEVGMTIPAHVSVQGPGITTRLTGRTVYNGRSSYVFSIEGSESLNNGDGVLTITAGGYAIVDAATGLWSANYSLTEFTGRSPDGQAISFQSLQTHQINF